MNPGTYDPYGNKKTQDFDIGIRRNRTGFYLHLFDRIITMSQLGISAQTFSSPRKPEIFFLDLVTEYALIKKNLYLGYGLNSYNGVARLSNVGAPQFLYADVPSFAYPLVGNSDQSGRQLGIYARGLIGDLDYRISYAKPFIALPDEYMEGITHTGIYSDESNAWKAYFSWQFLDNEEQIFPWKYMNYLGEKRIFNLGGGFYYQPNAIRSAGGLNGAEEQYDMLLTGLDAFVEWPTRRNASITAYLVWYNYDFGPNFIQRGGLMNTGFTHPVNDDIHMQGAGNSEWTYGTGNILHFEGGYLLPSFTRIKNQIQLYGGYTLKDFEALGCDLHQFDLGINYLIYKNHVKCGLQFSTRPIYEGSVGIDPDGNVVESKWTMIFNTQVDF
jgi:hypothetical protein